METTNEETKKQDKKNTKKDKPNILSRFFICWICPVLVKGNKRDINEDDLIDPKSKKYYSDSLGGKLERYWLEELESALQKNKKPSLWKAMCRAFWLHYMFGAVLIILNMTSRTIQPMLFSRLLSFWSVESTMSRQEAGYYALGMLASNSVSMMCQHHNSLFVGRFGLKIRVAFTSLMYRKMLRMSQTSIQSVPAGQLVNLMSNDMARFDYAFMFLHYLWLIPIHVSVVLYFMFDTAGYAPIVGLISVTLLVLPLQAILTKLTAIFRRRTAGRTDKRIKLMSEIISGIQVIKMYAWEIPFQKAVSAVRRFEIAALTKATFVNGTFFGFMMFTDRTTLFITILLIILNGNILTATTIYPVQQYFSIIQSNLSMILPMAITQLSEMFVTLDRIMNFLLKEERDDLSLMPSPTTANSANIFKTNMRNGANIIVTKKYSKNEDTIIVGPRKVADEVAIELTDVSASWTNDEKCTLRNITLRVRRGKLCAIIGSVGAGKSSLLHVLINELPATQGKCNVYGKISYSSQEPWLLGETVRNNIIFGLPYDSSKYQKVCRACCLLPDFQQFPYGDLSLVGERGVSLSGGQRARINLARSVYQEADIYLLDDPLSAVDANVGRQLFEGCIKGYLRGRTVVLVTHQIHFLKAADQIVVLNEGSIEDMGSYNELMRTDKELAMLRLNTQESVEEKSEESSKRPSLQRGVSVLSAKSDEIVAIEKEQIMAAEQRASGNLKWQVFFRYLSSVESWGIIFITILLFVITQAAATSYDFWISYWTNRNDEYIQVLEGAEPDTSLGAQVGPLTTAQYLMILGGLIIAVIAFTMLRLTIYVQMIMRASTHIHDLMFKNLIKAVMRFFDINPSGRVLNRFSKDIGAMDELLPRNIMQTVQMYLSMLSVLTLNAISLPWTLIPTVILLVIFMFLLKWYLNASQAVKRLEGTTKSPVFGMISSTFAGMTTIRSSGSQARLIKQFDDCQDLNTSAFYTYIGGTAAFSLYLDFICLVYLASIMAIFILIDFGNVVPVGSVGMAVSQSLTLTILLQFAARFTADLLAQMTAVERVLEYTNLPHEKNIDQGPITPPQEWPKNGEISFRNVYLSYVEDEPPILKNINLDLKTGWKIGVVGRTGAGKSSMINALFRLSNIDGVIKMDGIDTKDIALQVLRSKISIIPQEPVLFSATLRYNLDPFNLYSDDDIWKAIEQVELKESVPALDFEVTEGGGNFSVGQKQLVCLARALLRSNKVLVMDEATANVDPQTDALIQKTIRQAFRDCTVVTIAHRLNTIMDSDRVLVMDKGQVVEFDYPYRLLTNPKSLFSFMVGEAGAHTSTVLFEVAKTKYFEENPDENVNELR